MAQGFGVLIFAACKYQVGQMHVDLSLVAVLVTILAICVRP